ncbi:hypothetical protein [uncultured Chitinophaga sp.]|jgi:hypothetical protein|uniref:hypothetical protein n=1 Tax=uncultured Chitinophaga sp. TaxID=339340 RepID=UPI0026356279|nr:hypothetical protein [uncultured Chitinophaga sp.]
MKRTIYWKIILPVSLILFSCTGATRITGSWVNPETQPVKQDYHHIFIATMTKHAIARAQTENALSAELKRFNKRGLKSSDTFTPALLETLPAREELLQLIQQTGADAILTTSLLRTQSETRYVRSSVKYAPVPAYGWYRGFYAYYAHWYPMVYDTGYYVADKTYFVESNLYDARTEKLLWSAQTATVNPGSLEKFLAEYPGKVIAQMMRDGVLKP